MKMWMSSEYMFLVVACALPLCCVSLTCVNKQTAIANGRTTTTNQGGPSCTASKWCMKFTGESSANGDTSTGINSRCADGDSDEKTCDTQAANKCWTLNGANGKSEICCCNQDNCNDTPYKLSEEQVSSSANGGAPSVVAGPPGSAINGSAMPSRSGGNVSVDISSPSIRPTPVAASNASAASAPVNINASADANATRTVQPKPVVQSNNTVAEPEPVSNATTKATTKAPVAPPSASDKPANKPSAEPATAKNNAPTAASFSTMFALFTSVAIGCMML